MKLNRLIILSAAFLAVHAKAMNSVEKFYTQLIEKESNFNEFTDDNIPSDVKNELRSFIVNDSKIIASPFEPAPAPVPVSEIDTESFDKSLKYVDKKILNSANGDVLHTLPVTPTFFHFSPNSTYAAYAPSNLVTLSSSVTLIKMQGDPAPRTITSSQFDSKYADIKNIVFPSDDKLGVLLNNSEDMESYRLYLIDAASYQISKYYGVARSDTLPQIIVSPNRKTLLLYGYRNNGSDGMMSLMDVEKGQELGTITPIKKIEYSKDGNEILADYRSFAGPIILRTILIPESLLLRLVYNFLSYYRGQVIDMSDRAIAKKMLDNFTPNQIPWVKYILENKCAPAERERILKLFTGVNHSTASTTSLPGSDDDMDVGDDDFDFE